MFEHIAKAALLAAAVLAVHQPAEAQKQTKGQVLVVLSSAHELTLREGKTYETGNFFNEVAEPVKALIDAGYQPVFADPDGSPVHFDSHSIAPVYFSGSQAKLDEARKFLDGLEGLQHPKTLASVRADGIGQFVGIVVPGGHAPWQDLSTDPDLGALLVAFHESGKTTALLCHGPLALLSTLHDPAAFTQAMIKGDVPAAQKLAGDWPYAGYRMTVFSTSEERFVEPRLLHGQVQFYPSEGLSQAGALAEAGPDRRSMVVQDRELITGQQPFSGAEFTRVVISALDQAQAHQQARNQ